MLKINFKKNKGFVMLFAVTLSAILLSIALGLANIALKEVKFSTSAKDTNDAFYAADTGIESAFYNDKLGSYPMPPSGTSQSWPLVIYGLGSSGKSCVNVSIQKDNTNPVSPSSTFISKGYNLSNFAVCDTTYPNSIERVLKATYGSSLHFKIVASTPVRTGVQAVDGMTVTALDASNNVVTGYVGIVHFSSSDATANLPVDSPLTSGVGTFSFTMNSLGSQNISANDSFIIGTSNTITVVTP